MRNQTNYPTPDDTGPNYKQIPSAEVDVPQDIIPATGLNISMKVIPTKDILDKSSLILGVSIVHLASDTAKVIPINNQMIVRCDKCRAYINPYCKFLENGYKWQCPLCNTLNPTPTHYYAPLDGAGLRTDRKDKPELIEATVDFVATKDYYSRPPSPPTYFFLIDLVPKSHMIPCVQAIKAALQEISKSGDPSTQIGFVLFDESIYYVSLNQEFKQPKIFIQNNFDQFPLPEKYFISTLNDVQDNLLAFFEYLSKVEPKISEKTCFFDLFGPIFELMKVAGGGKLIIIQSHDKLGDNPHLKVENPSALVGKNKLLNITSNYFIEKASLITGGSLTTMDLFIFSNNYKNVANLSELSIISGGNLYYYPDFDSDPSKLYTKIYSELYQSIVSYVGWEGYCRLRTSDNFKIIQVLGNFSYRTNDLIGIPCIDQDKAFIYTLKYSAEDTTTLRLSENYNGLFVQIALLYTTNSRERRIRVSTGFYPISSNLELIYNSISPELMAYIISIKGLVKLREELSITKGIQEAKMLCAKIVKAYIKLQLAESIEYILFYVMEALRTKAFLSDHRITMPTF